MHMDTQPLECTPRPLMRRHSKLLRGHITPPQGVSTADGQSRHLVNELLQGPADIASLRGLFAQRHSSCLQGAFKALDLRAGPASGCHVSGGLDCI